MKNFRQFNEDASDKLSGMDDKQVDDLKKNNPGAAAKIDALRKKKAAQSSGQKALPTSALAKKPSGAETARLKARQSQMGKIAQGIKNAPKASAPQLSGAKKQLPAGSKGGALARTAQNAASGSAENKKPGRVPSNQFLKDQDRKSADAAAQKARSKAAAKAALDAKRRENEVKAKKAEDELTRKQAQRDGGALGGLKSSLGGDRFTRVRDGDTEATKKAKEDKRLAARRKDGERVGNAIKSAPGKVGNAIKGLGRKLAQTKTSGSVSSEGGDSMETLQRNSY